MAGEEKGFAARWSKRKVEARQDEKEELSVEIQDPADTDQQERSIEVEDIDKELLTEEDFADVDFDALDKSSDYTRFVNANVPAAIQSCMSRVSAACQSASSTILAISSSRLSLSSMPFLTAV